MPAKMTPAAFAVLLTAIFIQGMASAQNYSPPRGADQSVNRFTSRIPADARATQETTRAFGGAYGAAPAATQQPNQTWKRTYPEFPFQNGGGG
jgi:hypothetical protein